ncbi:MAG: DMT family transporter [Treponema sp.]|jgi:drug/metabolite transporter (DMT)-like permease|nr:DMT family transporter [Treponema sp.]
MKQKIQKEHRLAGEGAILLCAVLWSSSGLFIKLVDWHPMVISGSRSILAVMVLLILRFVSSGLKNGAKFSLKEAPILAACGLCYAATMITFVIANKLTASANVILLQYAAPVWAALLGWFFLKEKPRSENWCALVLVCAGMFLVFSSGLESGSVTGNVLAVISGIVFGANSVVLRARKDGSPADILIFSHIICALFSVPFFFMHPPSFTVSNIICISFMGIFQIGMASALFAYGIKRISALQAMLTAAIEPVLNPLWVLLVTGERPTTSVLIGGGIILAAVVFSSMLSALRRRS